MSSIIYQHVSSLSHKQKGWPLSILITLTKVSPSFVIVLVIWFVYSLDMFLNQLDLIYFGEHISTILSPISFSIITIVLSTHIQLSFYVIVYLLSVIITWKKSHSLFIQPALYILSTTWPAIWQIELLNDRAVLIALVAALNIFLSPTLYSRCQNLFPSRPIGIRSWPNLSFLWKIISLTIIV